ncbi:kinase-like domain-containing protein [Chytriomyces sp. MP71]|nr:kinase-like domain-containing protein [Chytriomyces sp. MP71]
MTILDFASSGDLASIEQLYSNGGEDVAALLETRDLQDNNALHIACREGHVEVIDWALARHIDVNARNIVGDTPLIIAANCGHKDAVVRLLQESSCQINAPNDHGNTPLHYVCYRRHTAILHILLKDEHLQINARNLYGKLPYDRTSTEIRRQVAAIAFMRSGGGGVSGSGAAGMVTDVCVQPDVEIPFAALNPSKPFLTTPRLQHMMGTWYMRPVQVLRAARQAAAAAEVRALHEEAEVLRGLRHVRLAALVGVCLAAPDVSVVWEYAGSTSLHDVLHDAAVEMDVGVVMRYAREVCGALKYLHEHSPPIHHLNINSKNIMISDMDGSGALKLTQYGHKDSNFRTWSSWIEVLASTNVKLEPEDAEAPSLDLCDLSPSAWLSSTEGIEYMAPELLPRQVVGPESVTDFAAVDTYAFGVLLLEIITRDTAYSGLSNADVYDKVSNTNESSADGPEIPDYIPPELIDILRQCFARDPQTRPRMSAVHDLLDTIDLE